MIYQNRGGNVASDDRGYVEAELVLEDRVDALRTNGTRCVSVESDHAETVVWWYMTAEAPHRDFNVRVNAGTFPTHP